MRSWEELLDRLESGFAGLEQLDESTRALVLTLLDAVDEAHRTAVSGLGRLLEPATLERLRRSDPAVAWLFEAYGVGRDARAAAESALDGIRPYIDSHGGKVEVLEVTDGTVRVRLSGACSGCTASAITLREGVERALRENLPGFAALEVEEDGDAASHPPPGPTLLQIENVPRR